MTPLIALLLAQIAGLPGQIQTPNAGRWVSTQGTYQCTSTGCVSRSMASKEADFTNINDFGGSDFCVQLSNAIASLAATGGTIDTRSVTGTVTCASNPFLNVTKAVTVLLGDATIQTTAPWVIANNAIHLHGNGTRTTYSYVGGASAYAFKVGTPTPSINAVQDIVMEKMVLKGNANTTDVLFITGVFRSFFTELNLRDATGACLHTQWSVVNTMKSIHCSGLDFLGAFTVTPANGFLFDDIGGTLGTTASTVIDPVAESVSGSGIKLIGVTQNMVITGGTSEANGRGIEITAAAGSQNTFIGIDLEQNTNEDILVSTAHNVFIGVLSTSTSAPAVHVIGNANVFLGGSYKTIQVDAGAKGNEFDVSYSTEPITDNGTDTKFGRMYNSTLGRLSQWNGSSGWTSRDIVPPITYSAVGTPDKQDTITGNYAFIGTTPVVLSNTVLAATVWRIVFAGVWANNQEGGGLAQPADYIEATTAAPTFTIGTVTMTVSLNGSGQLQMATGNATHRVGFSGRIYVYANLLGAAGTDAMRLKGKVTAGGFTASGGAISPSTDALASQANGLFQGSGAPSNGNGNNGDFYFRTDTPGTASQVLYIKSAGSWAAMSPATNFGSITLSSGTPSTGTATVTSGATCICSNSTTQANPVKCSVATTTLTATGPNTVTDVVKYACFL